MAVLSEEEFRGTFDREMVEISANEAAPFDFWPYVEAIPQGDFEGYDCSEGIVRHVYMDNTRQIQHVLISTKSDAEVFMVIVLDLRKGRVFGHKLLDLRSEYGLRESVRGLDDQEKDSTFDRRFTKRWLVSVSFGLVSLLFAFPLLVFEAIGYLAVPLSLAFSAVSVTFGAFSLLAKESKRYCAIGGTILGLIVPLRYLIGTLLN